MEVLILELKKLSERISEDLPLVDGAFNFFSLVVYDSKTILLKQT
jgi:hypothetical protein